MSKNGRTLFILGAIACLVLFSTTVSMGYSAPSPTATLR